MHAYFLPGEGGQGNGVRAVPSLSIAGQSSWVSGSSNLLVSIPAVNYYSAGSKKVTGVELWLREGLGNFQSLYSTHCPQECLRSPASHMLWYLFTGKRCREISKLCSSLRSIILFEIYFYCFLPDWRVPEGRGTLMYLWLHHFRSYKFITILKPIAYLYHFQFLQ